MIADTHVHVWDLERLRYDWLQENDTILNHSYTLAGLEPERIKAGVGAGVLVQAANTSEETGFLLQLAEETSWIKAVCGWVPLTEPERAKLLLEKYSSNNYFTAVRHLIHDEPDDRWLLQAPVLESLGILQEASLAFDFVGVTIGHPMFASAVNNK